jgi:WD40 repeat protein
VLLLGTRNGTIIEISLSSEFKKLQAAPGEMGRDIEKPGDVYEKKETYQEIKKIIFHARIIMNNHASQQQNTTDILTQRKIRFTVHPKQPIMVSSGADNDIMFWSTRTHKSRSSITLKSKATCIKFSPNGDYLCIGYENDKLEIISISFENKKPGDDESDMPAQKIVQRINEPQTYILNIEFSESSKQLAVSYLNKKEPEEGEKRITGYVNVFLLNSKYRDTLKNKEDLYIKYRTINSTASDSNLSTNIFYGCYYMSFSANEEYIIINFQQIDKNINKENDDKEKKYVIWDLKNNAPQDNIDLLSRETASGKLNFPNHVNAIYRYHEKYLEKSPDMALTDKQESLTSSKNLTISAMQYFDKFLFFGSGKGDISVVKDYCLQVPPNMTVESLRLDQYFLAKSYAAHCSAIENIEISDDKQKLFTSSASDEVIFEWTIKKGEPEWELDHTVYDLNMEDMFLREVEMREEHKKIITEMLEPRNQIIELQQNIDTKVEPEISLKLEKIIGRKAFNRRNNVYYTANNHLIFSAASLLVMIDIPPEGMDITPETKNQFFKEKFLEVDRGDADSTSPEISTFTLSPDRRYVCAGTIQKKAKLITWELTTNTFIKSWTLENCCVVLNIRYSSDKKRLVCIALTETYMQVVMLIDNATGEILGSTEFSYSIPFRIKDVDFLPKSNDEFVTIGFQHLSKWKLKGGLITFVELPIENPREMISKAGVLHVIQERKHRLLKKNLGPSIVNNVETFPLEVTFMSLIFLFDELMITAGDDGFVRSIDCSCIYGRTMLSFRKRMHTSTRLFIVCVLRSFIRVRIDR